MNKQIILMGLAIASSYSHAGDFSPIDNLQRLFTNAEQRVVIDKLKAMKGIPGEKNSNAYALPHTNTIKTTDKGDRISARGFVTKNNGFMLTWIKQNGQLKLNTVQKTSSVIRRNSNSVIHLKIDGQLHHIKIKPGQTYFRDEHIVYDDWQLGFTLLDKKIESLKKPDKPKKLKTKGKRRIIY